MSSMAYASCQSNIAQIQPQGSHGTNAALDVRGLGFKIPSSMVPLS